MTNPLPRALLRDAVAPAAAVASGGAALVVVQALVESLWSPAAPGSGAVLVTVVALSVPAAASVLVPAACAAGPVLALARWVAEGAWLGARTLGRSLRDLLPALVVIGALAGVGTAVATLWVEPAARRTARVALHDPAALPVPRPGAEVRFGGLRGTLGSEGAFLAAGDLRVGARTGRLVATDRGPVLVLEDGEVVGGGPVPWRARFARLHRPLPAPGAPRRELAERSWSELRDVADRTAAAGGDPSYERAVRHKRLLHPLAALLLPVALAPLGLARRPGVALAAVGLAYLLAVRAGDLLAPRVGPLLAASAGPLLVAVAALLAWRTWGRR